MISPEVKRIARDIRTMRVRGAGRIARAAAQALEITAKKSKAKTAKSFLREIDQTYKLILKTRPTAVSLPNALRYVTVGLRDIKADVPELRGNVISRAEEFIKESTDAVKRIGEIGSNRVSDGDVILTHCNSEAALSVIKTAYKKRKDIQVYVTESRPYYQGHISARALLKAGIPTTMIIDSSVRHFMREIDKVILGADSIAANGAVVNKIGTSTIALVAHEARVPFFVAAETYKFHPGTLVGQLVKIEERAPSEIVDTKKFPKMKIRNPSFDFTPAEYVDLIITERGIIPPTAAYAIIRELFGWELGEEI